MSFQFETDHRDYLRKEFRRRADRRPLYSQRAFARDLGLSASSLGDYFKDRMRLSPGRVVQISKILGLTLEQRQHWLDLLDEKFAKNDESRKMAQLRVKSRLQAQSHSLSVDQFKVISEWFHMAYLELVDMNPAKYSNLSVAATALGLPVKTLRIAIKRLEHVGFLKKDKAGHYVVDSSTRIGDEMPSEAIRQFHGEILKKASSALETQDMSRRYNSSTVIALPKDDVQKVMVGLKSLAIQFLDPYLSPTPTRKKDALYCLSLQFFDLLQRSGK